jgi:hypothetical protein
MFRRPSGSKCCCGCFELGYIYCQGTRQHGFHYYYTLPWLDPDLVDKILDPDPSKRLGSRSQAGSANTGKGSLRESTEKNVSKITTIKKVQY